MLKRFSLKRVRTSLLLDINSRSPLMSWLSTVKHRQDLPQQRWGSGAGAKWNNRKECPQNWTNEMSDPDARDPHKVLQVTNGLMVQYQPLTLGVLPYVINIAKTAHPVRCPSRCPLICPGTQAPVSIHLTRPTKQLFRREQTQNPPPRF